MARRAHAFHRFAHHPLCDRYAGELVPLGRRARLCRGCLFLGLGSAVGLALGLATRGLAFALPAEGGLLALALTAGVPSRLPKALKRFVPGLALGALVAHGPWAWSVAAVGLLGAQGVLYRRKGPHRAPCQTCPERTLPVCAGFRPIYRRERAVERWARGVLSERRAPIDTRVPPPL